MKNQKVYKPGDRLVTCDVCDFDYRFSEMRRGVALGQKGLVVCPECYDAPHPHDKKHEIQKKSQLPQVK